MSSRYPGMAEAIYAEAIVIRAAGPHMGFPGDRLMLDPHRRIPGFGICEIDFLTRRP